MCDIQKYSVGLILLKVWLQQTQSQASTEHRKNHSIQNELWSMKASFLWLNSLWKEHIENSLFLYTAHLIMNQCSTSFLMKLRHPHTYPFEVRRLFSMSVQPDEKASKMDMKNVGSFVMNTFQADWSHKTWYGQLTVTAFNQDWDGMKFISLVPGKLLVSSTKFSAWDSDWKS